MNMAYNLDQDRNFDYQNEENATSAGREKIQRKSQPSYARKRSPSCPQRHSPSPQQAIRLVVLATSGSGWGLSRSPAGTIAGRIQKRPQGNTRRKQNGTAIGPRSSRPFHGAVLAGVDDGQRSRGR